MSDLRIDELLGQRYLRALAIAGCLAFAAGSVANFVYAKRNPDADYYMRNSRPSVPTISAPEDTESRNISPLVANATPSHLSTKRGPSVAYAPSDPILSSILARFADTKINPSITMSIDDLKRFNSILIKDVNCSIADDVQFCEKIKGNLNNVAGR